MIPLDAAASEVQRLSKDLTASGLHGGWAPTSSNGCVDFTAATRNFGQQFPRQCRGIPCRDRDCNEFGDFRDSVAESLGQELPPLPAAAVFRLSWSHLVELLRLDAPWKRAFYENETLRAS